MSFDPTAPGWIVGPAGWAIQYVAEETKLASTIQRGLVVLESNQILLLAARKLLSEHGQDDSVAGIDLLLREAPTLSEWSTELKSQDYAPVNSHSLIGIWCAVEIAIEDTVALILMKDPSAIDILKNHGVKVGNESILVDETRARWLYRRFESFLRNELTVAETYQKMLGILGIQVACNHHCLIKLTEINEVRNCLLHGAGKIDERAAEKVEALRSFRGQTFPIPRSRYLEYHSAVSEFLRSLLTGVLSSKYMPTGSVAS